MTKNVTLSRISCDHSTRSQLRFVRLPAITLVLLTSCNCVLQAQSFRPLGNLDGRGMSQALSISEDGLVIVGSNHDGVGNQDAIRWTQASGIVKLGVGVATDVSGDGLTTVGCLTCDEMLAGGHPAQWQNAILDADMSVKGVIETVSSDGSFTAGTSSGRAFRWTATEGNVELFLSRDEPGGFAGGGVFSRVVNMSPDGSVLVGEARTANGLVAVRWTDSGASCPTYPACGRYLRDNAGNPIFGSATATSSDGTVVVGTATTELGNQAFRWTLNQGVSLLDGLLAANLSSDALDVSADGATIVGSFGADRREAFIWHPDTGMQNLQQMLTNDYGLDLSGWNLTEATGISADGTTIIGNSLQGAWVADLSSSIETLGDFDGDGLASVADIDLLAAAVRNSSADMRFDLNGSGVVDSADHSEMINTVLGTSYGDSNLDGVFNSSDLIRVFGVGAYEDNIPANGSWENGDWDANGDFEPGDLVVAFRQGGYEQTRVEVVPEPAAVTMLFQMLAIVLLSLRIPQRADRDAR